MLGRKNDNSPNTDLVFIRDISSVSKKAEEFRGRTGVPYFDITKKIDGEWKSVGKEDTFSGVLLSVSTNKRYDEKDDKQRDNIDKFGNPYVLKVEVVDVEAGETYVWKTGFTISARTALNSLFNVNLGESIQMSIGKKKTGYDSLFIRKINNGVVEDRTVGWKFDLDEVPKASETIFKGKVMRDYSEVDEFFVSKTKEFFGDRRANVPQIKANADAGHDDFVEKLDEIEDSIGF